MTVFKSKFDCKQLFSPASSFEKSLLKLDYSTALLCAVVYRPPRYNKDFLNDLSDFMADLIPRYDQVVIVGNLNIQVCCPDKPLVKDFLYLVDSFTLIQSISCPTQECGHTLDLGPWFIYL